MSRTIVMVHGMFAAGAVWLNYVDYFESRGYTCLKPTLRFHDMDPQDQPDPRLGTTGVADYVEDLEQVIGALYDPPVIMGHGMGGLLAQLLAAKGLGSALVLLCPAAPAGIWTVLNPDFRAAFSRYRWRWGSRRKPWRIGFKAACRAVYNLLPPEDRRRQYETLVYESGQAISEIGRWYADRNKATRIDAAAIKIPTLIIGASQDRMSPAAMTRKIAKKYAHVASYREFEDHAHWVLGEPGWDGVAAYVFRWLRETGRPRRPSEQVPS